MSKPTLVLIHGSWHRPVHYELLQKELEKHSYNYVAINMPSTQSPDQPPANLVDDISAVRTAVKNELESNDVVVIAHSFGGTITNAALEGLDSKTRSALGASTSVKAIAFMCAIPMPKGISFLDVIGGKLGPMHDLRNEYFTWVSDPPGGSHYFYNDLSPEEGKKWSDLLLPQSQSATYGVAPYAAYMDIPCGYLYCKQDNAFPFEGQKGMIGAAIESGAKFFHEETLDASHSPFLSMPVETAKFVRRVAGETVL